MYERQIRRYTAYFLGWCQAFGEHDVDFDESKDFNWLFGDAKIGIIVSSSVRKLFLKDILRQENPAIFLSCSGIKIKGSHYAAFENEKKVFKYVLDFLKKPSEIHMFLSSHLCYPPKTRIITFSTKKPLLILYKEIPPLTVKID